MMYSKIECWESQRHITQTFNDCKSRLDRIAHSSSSPDDLQYTANVNCPPPTNHCRLIEAITHYSRQHTSSMHDSMAVKLIHENRIHKNQIKTIDKSAFKANPNLESIDLKDDSIDFIDSKVFNNLTKLRKL